MNGLEYCDIDEQPNEHQLAHLDEYDVVYLTGGDPLLFCRRLGRGGLGERLQACLAAGRLLVGASGGAMYLTKNVSLFRLLTGTADDVARTHGNHTGLSMVDYEILPHLNRHDAPFLERVRSYSELLPHDVVALEDGAAMVYTGGGGPRCSGRAVRFRRGTESPIDAIV